MSNEVSIKKFKLGKYDINTNRLDNFDKVKYARIENLLKELIKLYELQKKLMVGFDEGRYELK